VIDVNISPFDINVSARFKPLVIGAQINCKQWSKQPTEPTSIEEEPEIAPTEEGGEPTEEGTDDPVSADENAQMPSDEELDAVFAEFGL
jgi:hypothetical protein